MRQRAHPQQMMPMVARGQGSTSGTSSGETSSCAQPPVASRRLPIHPQPQHSHPATATPFQNRFAGLWGGNVELESCFPHGTLPDAPGRKMATGEQKAKNVKSVPYGSASRQARSGDVEQGEPSEAPSARLRPKHLHHWYKSVAGGFRCACEVWR
jgi:hypothetical protein